MQFRGRVAARTRLLRAIVGALLSFAGVAAPAAAQDLSVPVGGLLDGSLATSTPIPKPAGIARTSTGTLYFSAPDAGRIYKIGTDGRLQLIAGGGTAAGVDGIPAVAARLIRPVSITLAFGKLFVAETGANRIRSIDLASGLITTLTGQGGELNNPSAIAYDLNAGILIADTGNHRVTRVNIFTGVMTPVAGTGTAGFSGDGGAATSAQLNAPTGVAMCVSNHVLIADARNNRVRRVDSQNQVITTFAEVAAATLGCAPNGDLLFVARDSARVDRVVFSSGIVTHEIGGTTSGYSGDLVPAYSAAINTNLASGFAVDADGQIYLADSENFRIRRTAWATGAISTVAGNGAPVDGGALAVDRLGNLFVADPVTRRINKVDAVSGYVSTVAGGGPGSGDGDGLLAVDASFKAPANVAVDTAGNLFVGDTSVVRKISAITGLISTVAGRASQNGFSGDGGPATSATLGCCFLPVAVDSHGNLFIADRNNKRIRKVDAATGVITTIAGSGSEYFATVSAGAAGFKNLSAIAVDDGDNVLVADSETQLVRRLNVTTNLIATLAGTGAAFIEGVNGDGGPAAAARLNRPRGLAVDAAGNVYIAEAGSTIRRVDAATGKIGTVDVTSDDATADTLAAIRGIAATASDRLAVADLLNHRIRIVPSSAATAAPVTPVITWHPAPAVYTLPLDNRQLNATADVAGSFIYDPPPGTLLPVGSRSLSLTFIPTDPETYRSVSTSVTIEVQKFTPPITWSAPAAIGSGMALSSEQLNARVPLLGAGHYAGDFVYSPAAGTILPPGVHTLTVAFQPIDPGYTWATATTTIRVTPGASVISWSTPAPIKVGTPLGAAQLNATANVPGAFAYTPPAGTVLPLGGQALSVTFRPDDQATYNTVTRTVFVTVVAKFTPVITWTPPVDIVFGTALSATQLNATANISGTFMYSPAAGTQLLPIGTPQTLSVTFTPADSAGYTTAAATVPILVRPSTTVLSLSASPTSASPGTAITAILQNGPGNRTDWVGIYAAGNGSLIDWKYLNGSQTAPLAGQAAARLTFSAPNAAGDYVLRLLNGATVLTSSPTISVTAYNVTLSTDRTTAATGSTVSAIVTGAAGAARDWVGLYTVGGSNLLDWYYLNGSQAAPLEGRTGGTVPFRMPATPGSYEFRFFTPASARLATSAAIAIADAPPAVASITVPADQTTVAPGATVIASFANGPGMVRDWVGIYPAGSSTLLDWMYLHGGPAVPVNPVTSGTLAVRMPTTPGSYVLRFYSALNVLLATSPTLTVVVNPISLTVSPTTVAAGGSVSFTVTGGPGNRNDWLGVYESGSANYVKWVYLNGSQNLPDSGMASATASVTMPTTPGTYTIKLYTGSAVLATSVTITVTAAPSTTPPTASLTATPATIRPQGTVSATIAGGGGNATDWVALYPTGSSNYLEWKYLNGSTTAPLVGLTTATVPFTMPATPGTYVLKFWGGGTLLATSGTITVANPTVTVTATTAASGEAVTTTVANGPGRSTDWIGIYVTGAASYVDWVYLNGSKSAPASGMSNAAVPLVMPALPGSYTLKFFTGATQLAISEPVVVR